MSAAFAKRHAELLGRGQIDERASAGVCDVDGARAVPSARGAGVPWFADMAQMFESVEADVAHHPDAERDAPSTP